MGTWGYGIFEDDTALDFAGEVVESQLSKNEIVERLRTVASRSFEYLDADDGQEALVSAQVIASTISGSVPEHLDGMPKYSFSGEEAAMAREAVLVVLDDANSELKDLWEEAEEHHLWKAEIDKLVAQLS